ENALTFHFSVPDWMPELLELASWRTVPPQNLPRTPIDHSGATNQSYPTDRPPPTPLSAALVLLSLVFCRSRMAMPSMPPTWSPPSGSGYQSMNGPSTPKFALTSPALENELPLTVKVGFTACWNMYSPPMTTPLPTVPPMPRSKAMPPPLMPYWVLVGSGST